MSFPEYDENRELVNQLQEKADIHPGGLPMRKLTSQEIKVLRHICLHGWVDEVDDVDRAKLLSQLEHLTARSGCDVEDCPCIEFAYQGQLVWQKPPVLADEDRATDVASTTLVMDIKDSEWQSNLFVEGGVLSFLEFSSFDNDYPSRLPSTDELM